MNDVNDRNEPNELLEILHRFRAVWPGTQASDETLAEYLDALEPYGAEALSHALERLRATWRSSFLPSIADVREVCETFAAGQRAATRYCSYLAHAPYQHPAEGRRILLYLGGYEYPVSCPECEPLAFARERAALLAHHRREGLPLDAVPPEVAQALAAAEARMAMPGQAARDAEAVRLWCSECGDASSSRWGNQPGQPHMIGEKLAGRRIVSACPGMWQLERPQRRAA